MASTFVPYLLLNIESKLALASLRFCQISIDGTAQRSFFVWSVCENILPRGLMVWHLFLDQVVPGSSPGEATER